MEQNSVQCSLIFSEGAKIIQWGKESFQEMVLKQQGIHTQKQKLKTMNLDSYLTPYKNIKMNHRTKCNH